MAVVECPVCGSKVNAEAVHCPQCGADPRLDTEEARSDLLARRGAIISQGARLTKPVHGWGRRTRVLTLFPGLFPSAFLLGLGVWVFVSGARFYFSLLHAERIADGDPFADAGMWFGVAIVFVGLVFCAPALVAALPRRLPWWPGSIAIAANLFFLTCSLMLGSREPSTTRW